MNEEEKRFVVELAKELYLQKCWWKKYRFLKWYRSNNWDVLYIYQDCWHQAKYVMEENRKILINPHSQVENK